MKYWNELDGSVFFNKVFSRAIEIKKAYIHSLKIENNQYSFGIGFDIPEFPDRLPEKWKDKGYTTYRIGLSPETTPGRTLIYKNKGAISAP